MNVAFSGRVLVVGCVAIDTTYNLQHFPEAGSSTQMTSLTSSPGGKAVCQSICASGLGARVRLLGAIGNDDGGEEVRRYLYGSKVDIEKSLFVINGSPTDSVTILLEPNQPPRFLASAGASYRLSPHHLKESGIDLSSIDVVCASYAVQPEVLQTLFEGSKKRKIVVVFNAGPTEPISDLSNPTLAKTFSLTDYLIVKPHEAKAYLGDKTDINDYAALAQGLLKCGPKNVIITDGATFGYGISSQQETITFSTYSSIEILDVSGSTDAFCATLAVALCTGYSQIDAYKLAWAAGNYTAQELGILRSMPDKLQLDSFLRKNKNEDAVRLVKKKK